MQSSQDAAGHADISLSRPFDPSRRGLKQAAFATSCPKDGPAGEMHICAALHTNIICHAHTCSPEDAVPVPDQMSRFV